MNDIHSRFNRFEPARKDSSGAPTVTPRLEFVRSSQARSIRSWRGSVRNQKALPATFLIEGAAPRGFQTFPIV